MKRITLLPLALFCAAALFACSESEEVLPRLEFLASTPKEVRVGDTTGVQLIRKHFVDARGKRDDVSNYASFTFKSSDTTVLKVVDGRRLLGVKEGLASVDAFDNQSDARTESAMVVTVKP